MSSHVYHFGEYRLDPTARELWRGDRLVTLPRRVLDALVFLIEHRHRAVSYDDLIAALWGHSHVTNARVSQLILQVRKAVGDAGRVRRAIRTLSGFGYRWILEVDTVAGPPSDDAPLARRTGDAVAVLPLEIASDGTGDTAWMRLGLMDLIAQRLRDTGLTVIPSDSVVSALHVAGGADSDEHQAVLRRMLGVDTLIQGSARHDRGTWVMILTAGAANGVRWRVECRQVGATALARQAADLMLATLGRTPPEAGDDNPTLHEWLLRVRAAVLAEELDTARAVLERAPDQVRGEPELRYEQAYVASQSGDFATAGAVLAELLREPKVIRAPRLHARALILRGRLAVRQSGLTEWDAAIADFDAALDALRDQPWAAEAGLALTNRGIANAFKRHFRAAMRDLCRARIQFEASCDQQGLSYVHGYFGALEIIRNRFEPALRHYRTAATISRSFGAMDRLRASLLGMIEAQLYLLHWNDALDTSEQVQAFKSRTEAAAQPADADILHAFILVAVGRHREAGPLLARYRDAALKRPGFPFAYRALALMAWQQGRVRETLAITSRILDAWPGVAGVDFDHRARLTLMRQRAALVLGGTLPTRSFADRMPMATPEADVLAVCAVARAEWAAHHGQHERAAEQFEHACDLAESECTPNTLALVADAHACWLLGRGDLAGASASAGRVAEWADQDFNCALLQVRVMHAGGQGEAWARALRQARSLAGERTLPADLLTPPVGINGGCP